MSDFATSVPAGAQGHAGRSAALSRATQEHRRRPNQRTGNHRRLDHVASGEPTAANWSLLASDSSITFMSLISAPELERCPRSYGSKADQAEAGPTRRRPRTKSPRPRARTARPARASGSVSAPVRDKISPMNPGCGSGRAPCGRGRSFPRSVPARRPPSPASPAPGSVTPGRSTGTTVGATTGLPYGSCVEIDALPVGRDVPRLRRRRCRGSATTVRLSRRRHQHRGHRGEEGRKRYFAEMGPHLSNFRHFGPEN